VIASEMIGVTGGSVKMVDYDRHPLALFVDQFVGREVHRSATAKSLS
jgi:hypothetical protein